VSGDFNTGTPNGIFNTNGNLCDGATVSFEEHSTEQTYNYYCTPHRGMGMTGVINVQ
jgi:plastocyanin